MKKHLIAFILVMCLCMTQTPAYVFAAETTSNSSYQEIEEVTTDYVNPLYADTVTEDDLLTEEEVDEIEPEFSEDEASMCTTSWNQGHSSYASLTYNKTQAACVKALRAGIKARTTKIKVYYRKTSEITSEELQEIGELAFTHTGDPTEGDYLKYQYEGWRGAASGYTSNGYYYLTLTYIFTYYTSSDQEAEMDSSVASLLDSLNLEGLSDYQKLYAIYDYVCSNVTYDYDTLSDDTYKLKFTAYAALQNKTAVCQGYAVLMYRLLLEEDIDARVITGIGNGGSHAWNIVKVDGKYYDIDSTWDASYKHAGYSFRFFLKSDEDFTDHERGDEFTTDEFVSAYPVSTEDYVTDEEPVAQSETEEEPAHTHEAVVVPAVAATCTESGLTEGSVCATCGETLVAQEVVPALGHTIVTDPCVEATCTNTGLTEGSHCSVCGAIITAQEETPMTDHTWDEGAITTEPTCCKAGERTYTCTDCGATVTEEIPATGEHTYNDGVVTKNATCTESGVMTYTCTEDGCDASYTEAIPATGHNVVVDEAVAPTCTEEGLTEGSHCSICKEVLTAQESVPTVDHLAVVDAGVPATCNETGLTEGAHCAVCGKVLVEQETIPTTDHNVVTDEAVAATCTETGLTEGSHCSICGKVIKGQETIPMTEHTAVTDGAVAATCTETGLTEGSHCSVCGKVLVKQETVPMTEHTAVTDGAVAATCTETGLTEGSHCSVCGKVLVKQETVPMTEHTAVTDEAVAATCTETGLTEGSHCAVCGKVIKAQETTPKADHTWNAGEVTIKATGSKTGEMTYTCTVCGTTRTEEIPATGIHTYDKGTVTKEATCTEDGVMTYKCTEDGCDASYTEVIPATGHTVVTDKAIAATCTETGLTVGSHCSVCGKVLVKQEVIPVTDHIAVTDEAVAATCTKTGLTEGSHCFICGKVLKAQETTPVTDHTWNEGEVTKKATGSKAGVMTYTCTACGATKTEEIAATGKHTYDDGVVTKKATCTEAGVMTYTCTEEDCDASYTEVIPATGHNEVVDQAVAATCTENGLTEGSHCSTCGEVIKAQETVKKTGHSWNQGEITKKAACTTAGVMTYTCTACGETKTEEIAATGKHTYDDGVVTKKATCTEAGEITYTCTVCGETKTEEIAATGKHTYDDGVVTKKATCTEAGEMTYTCTVCGETKMEEIAATGHSFTKYTYNNDATYTADGTETATCDKCGATNTRTSSGTMLKLSSTSTTASNTTSGIRLLWNRIFGASSYKIYRKSSTANTYTQIATVTSSNAATLSYTDITAENGKTYTYMTKACNSAQQSSSNATTIARLSTVSITETSSKKMSVSWNKNIKADGYQVVYATRSSFSDAKTINLSSYKSVSKVISGLSKGKTCYVKVRAYKIVNGKKYYSDYSSVKKINATR